MNTEVLTNKKSCSKDYGGVDFRGEFITNHLQETLSSPHVIDTFEWINAFAQELLLYTDSYVILDRILFEARKITLAEAGTVYLVEDDELVFAYTHNDKLFPSSKECKLIYSNSRLKISPYSIAGHCANTKELLFLDDVRNVPKEYHFSFNDKLDRETNYTTVSMFCIPLLGHNNKLLGVLQLINRQENGKSVPFPSSLASLIKLLAMQASGAIERAQLIRTMVLRLHDIIKLNDPDETGGHVDRVGAVTAEIYEYISRKQGTNVDERRAIRGQIRLAAMLHDIGKVGIPKEILKKPDRLTSEEYEIIKEHTVLGGDLFSSTLETTDRLSKEIATHHHQRWNGKGYSGSPTIPILSGKDIPQSARIVAVADVFDALLSKRCYKESQTWEQTIEEIKRLSGIDFDPEIVDAFLEIQDTVVEIYNKYKD